MFDTLEEERTEFIPDAALDQEVLKQALHAMLDALPEEQRSALMMRYFEELSVSQIAEIQGVSEGTVKSRLNYGRKALGKAVEDYEKKNGIKLHCVGVVPLLLWLFAKGSKGAVAATAATTATATTATTATTASTATTATAASTSGIATKLVAGGVAVALTAGGITGAVLLRPKDKPVTPPPEKSLAWSGYGHAETPVNNRHFQLTLTEFTEENVTGRLEVTYCYEEFYSTDFTGTGTEAEDGTITYTLECQTLPEGGTDPSATLIYDPQTEQMAFDNIYYYGATMDRWPLKEGAMISQKEQWRGSGSCDSCGTDDHEFAIEFEEMTEISAKGRISVYKDGQLEHTGKFTARGARTDNGSWYEVLLDEPWPAPHYPKYPTKEFNLEYDRETDRLEFVALWFHAELQREIH